MLREDEDFARVDEDFLMTAPNARVTAIECNSVAPPGNNVNFYSCIS